MSDTTTTARILIVDDNPEIHNDFEKILGNKQSIDQDFCQLAELFGDTDGDDNIGLNVEIDSAMQGEEAIEMVRQSIRDGKPYSLAFVDVRMPPGLDGVQTTQKLWEIDPEIQIVICSAYSDYSWQEIVAQLKHSDQFLILKKPFESIEVRQLANALHHRWLEGRRDNLTGLTNREAFVDYFRRQLRCAQQENATLSCVMIDIDFFKRINDLHGHAVGDLAIQQMADMLSTLCRNGDHVCRYGGEEFCVLLRGADEQAACKWAERARLKLHEISVPVSDDQCIFFTASFGVAELNTGTNTPEQLIDQADKSLRSAKELGRDRVCSANTTSTNCRSNCHLLGRPFFSIETGSMMQPVNVINRNATLRDAAALLIENGISAATVVDDQGVMVGVLTESDLLRVFSAGSDQQKGVFEAMRASVVGFSETTNLQEIFEFVVRVSIPQVVIVRDGRPCGVIPRKALLEWLYSNGFGQESECNSRSVADTTKAGTMPVIEFPALPGDIPNTTA